jgi:hypothetical protein
MKILFYKYSQDMNFDAIISVIAKTKHQFGYLAGEINQQQLIGFNPDLIIHNIPDIDKFPINTNAVSININEVDNKNSFSFKNVNSKNYIGKFVHFKSTEINKNDLSKYQSDVIYIGSPSIFNSLLNFLTSDEINFKFFTHQPHNINGYCGMCDISDYYKFYKYAKASIVNKDDAERIMDIVVADGNPIVYNGSNAEECIEKIKNAIHLNTKYQIDGYEKNDIISNHTSFDRASKIFKTIGMNKIAEDILKNKNIDWHKK